MTSVTAQILQNVTQVEVPRRGRQRRMWLARNMVGSWALYGTYGPTWAYNIRAGRWDITTDPAFSTAGGDYHMDDLEGIFVLAYHAPDIKPEPAPAPSPPPAPRSIKHLKPGQKVRVGYRNFVPTANDVFVRFEGEGEDRRAFFHAEDSTPGSTWEAYMFQGRWCVGSSADTAKLYPPIAEA